MPTEFSEGERIFLGSLNQSWEGSGKAGFEGKTEVSITGNPMSSLDFLIEQGRRERAAKREPTFNFGLE